MAKRLITSTVLMPTKSISRFIIEQLLEGLPVQVMIDDQLCTGYVHQLDFAKGSDYVFADICIPDPNNPEESIYLKVSIHTNGKVEIMSDQPE